MKMTGPWSPEEFELLKSLNTPESVQAFLDDRIAWFRQKRAVQNLVSGYKAIRKTVDLLKE